jgi:hypothetical protein
MLTLSISTVPSRSSSVMNLNHPPPRQEIDKMVEEGKNSRNMVEENLAKNIGVTPDSQDRSRKSEENLSPTKKSVTVTPR